jgi:nitrile hydratase alpha subunit
MEKKESSKAFSRLVEKAWSDEAFKERLLTDGARVLKEAGINVPEGVDVKFLENSEKVVHVVLPSPPPLDGELSGIELEAVVGGDILIPLDCDPGVARDSLEGPVYVDP